MDITNIRIASYSYYLRPCHHAPPPIKTPTRSSTRNRRGTYFAITPLTLSPITSTPGGGSGGAVVVMEYVGVYLAIAVSVYINIVYKRVTDIAKDI